MWAAPTARVIDTAFTDGHLVGAEMARRALTEGGAGGLHSALAGWPEGVMLRPFLWPLVLLSVVVGPALAFNLGWALCPALGALGGAALARSLGASTWGATLSGALLAWPMWSRVTLGNGQLEQALLGGVALVWAAALHGERRAGHRLLGAPLLLLGLGLAAPNLGLAAALGLACLGAGRALEGIWPAGPRLPGLARRRLLRWGMMGALSIGATLLIDRYHAANFSSEPNLYRPRAEARAAGTERAHIDPPPEKVSGWSATQTNLLSSASARSLLQPVGPQGFAILPAHVPYLGWTLLLAGGLGLLRGGRRSLALGVVIGTALCFSLGDRVRLGGQDWWMPWALVERLSRSAASSGSPYRLVVAAVVGLSAAAGVGLLPQRPGVARGGGRAAALTVVVGLAAWVETSALPGVPLPLPSRALSIHPGLAALQGSDAPALDLPLPFRRECETAPPHYMSGLLLHGRPLLHNLNPRGAYFGETELVLALDRLLGGPACEEKLKEALVFMGIGAVVVHREPPCALEPRVLACLHAALGPPAVDEPTTLAWTLP